MGVLPHNPHRKQLLVMATTTWLMFFFIVLFIQPAFIQNILWQNSYLPLFIILGFACFWLIWGISGRWKRSLTWSGASVLFVYFRINQLDSWINIVLLLCFCFVWEYYWYLSKQSSHLIK